MVERMSSLRQQNIESPPGGVMTRRVGAVTGPLILRLCGKHDGKAHVQIAYEGTDEFYEVTGSPLTARAHLALDAAARLQLDPGVDENGNPRASDLRAL
jgi:hypothetical protein